MHGTSSPDFARVWQTAPDRRARIDVLVEIYATALAELRRLQIPRAAGLIATLESLHASAVRERRYLDAAEDASHRLLADGRRLEAAGQGFEP